VDRFIENYRKVMEIIAKVLLIFTGAIVCYMVLIINVEIFLHNTIKTYPAWLTGTAVLGMIYVGFIGAAVVYRNRLHIGIKLFLMKMNPKVRNKVYFLIDFLIGMFALFMLIWGTNLAWVMRGNKLSATQWSVGISYLPIPLSGLFILLFVVEKIMIDFTERKTGTSGETLMPGWEE
jgi:TRAP-type C4-dicarboxylate transport system permease small subunit